MQVMFRQEIGWAGASGAARVIMDGIQLVKLVYLCTKLVDKK